MAYTPHTWTTGETVDAAKLNANEQGTQAAAAAADTANTGLTSKVNSSTYTAGLATKADVASLATVATSGSYADLSNKPAIPAAAANATTSAPGLVQLAGDLGGTAASPTVAKIGGVSILLSDTRPGSPATGLVRIGLAATGTPDTTAPSTPTGLTVTPGNAQNVLAWTASTDNVAVTGYKVRRGGTIVGTPTGTGYTDTGLTNGTAYSYTVSAVDAAANESAQTSAVTGTPTSGADSTAPTAPTNLAAGTPTSTTIPLTWTASTDNVGVVAYDVYNSGTLLQSGLTGTAGTVTGLTASTAYVLTLKARDAAGNASTASNTVNVSTASSAAVGTDPATVTGLTAQWKADSLSASNGAEVLSLPASAGSATGTTFTQVAGSGPTFVTAGQNSLPILRFAGTAKYMSHAAAMSAPMSGTDTMFIVARWSTFAATSLLGNHATANQYALGGFSSNQLVFFNSGSNYTTLTTLSGLTSWHVFAVRRNGTTASGVQLYVDGTLFASATASAVTTASSLDLMNNGANNAVTNSQEFGELAVYAATVLTDAQVTGITRFLGNKWGITVA